MERLNTVYQSSQLGHTNDHCFVQIWAYFIQKKIILWRRKLQIHKSKTIANIGLSISIYCQIIIMIMLLNYCKLHIKSFIWLKVCSSASTCIIYKIQNMPGITLNWISVNRSFQVSAVEILMDFWKTAQFITEHFECRRWRSW